MLSPNACLKDDNLISSERACSSPTSDFPLTPLYKQSTLLLWVSDPHDAVKGKVWLRPRDGQRHRVLGAAQLVRAAPVPLELQPGPVHDSARPPVRVREQPQTVRVQAVPWRRAGNVLVREGEREREAAVFEYFWFSRATLAAVTPAEVAFFSVPPPVRFCCMSCFVGVLGGDKRTKRTTLRPWRRKRGRSSLRKLKVCVFF